ncbi:superoxide reductase [Variovorax sp. HW608]|uniref:desulfoferrodoxin family protein n=1 Tax=Variovorax sp. HW608 TaxID=1034889 RepID=UPI00081F94C8|nr:desulfoferrodoxin family protein [Variovorax sp. HW608]SCK50560.1 superoxide reductase [Variovorax sp. HW608]
MSRNSSDAARPVAAALAFAMGLCMAFAAHGEEDQAQQFTPEFRELHKGFDGKHTPKITAPDSVKRGAWFNVTISIGAESPHPSLQEHFVRYIALYKDTVEIARAYLHPVYSSPTVTFTVALDEGGSLRAIAEPTHSAAWEASKKINVVP